MKDVYLKEVEDLTKECFESKKLYDNCLITDTFPRATCDCPYYEHRGVHNKKEKLLEEVLDAFTL